MSMQEFEDSRSQQQDLQPDLNIDPREEYQEEARHEPYPSLLSAPYSIEEKIRPERRSAEGRSKYTQQSRAGFWPAIIFMVALSLMGIVGVLGYGLSRQFSGQPDPYIQPISPARHYYSHPHFDHRFTMPYDNNDDRSFP